jgi:uncharacterized protein YdhG (YjbR/CyaY superfamily)
VHAELFLRARKGGFMDERYKSIDEYLKNYPEDIRIILEKMRSVVKKAVPQAVEAISYQMPTFKLNGKNLVHFAAFKSHIGFYPTPSGIKTFQKELLSYRSGKGSVRFPLDQPVPYDLVEKIVAFRVKEILERPIKKNK